MHDMTFGDSLSGFVTSLFYTYAHPAVESNMTSLTAQSAGCYRSQVHIWTFLNGASQNVSFWDDGG